MIESHPADFTEWLSGKGSASDPPGWAWRRTQAGVTVGPNHARGIAIVGAVAALLAAGLVFLIVISRDRGTPDGLGDILKVAIGLGMAAVIAVLATLVVSLVRDQRAGPYLIYRPGHRAFELPRAALVFPASEVRGWRVVTGNWVGSRNVQTRHSSARSELQLIANTAVGPTAYLVCSWMKASLADSLRELALATGLPLEIIDQRDTEYGAESARLRDAG